MIVAQSIARLKLLVPQTVDIDALMDVYADDVKLNDVALLAWPTGEGKLGLGLGGLGAGPLGLGDAIGSGLGDFPLGMGPLGLGQDYVEYLTPELDDGVHVFEVVVADMAGNVDEPVTTATLDMTGKPAAPADLQASGEAGVVTLTWTKSIDDITGA